MDFSTETITSLTQTYIIPYGINFVLAILIFVIGKWGTKTVTKLLENILLKSKTEQVLIDFVSGIVGSLLLLFVIIAALGQLGVDTTSLVALIGAAGLAIGLALQSSLQNFASGVMLIMFRPFTAGDFVEVAGTSGTVEKITIFSTILKSGDNKEITVPNGSIYGGIIVNYSAKATRRIDMVIGIGYGDDIKLAKNIMQLIIDADDRILKDPAATIALAELADSSVNFILRPWVNSADYWAVKFDLLENIKCTFDDKGISIPYPQIDVHIDK